MKYMLLIVSDPSAWAKLDDATQGAVGQEYGTFTQTIVDSKEFVTGDPLQGPETATTVSVKNGKRLTTDGPFAETKEQLGGFWVIDVADLDAALAWATKGSKACGAPVEVRPFQDDSAE